MLASSATQDELRFYERLAGIEDLLDEQTSSDDSEKSKLHPDIVEAAMQRLPGIDRADVVVAGEAGLRTIGVLCGGFAEQDLRAAGCIAIFRDPADLIARYEQSPLR